MSVYEQEKEQLKQKQQQQQQCVEHKILPTNQCFLARTIAKC